MYQKNKTITWVSSNETVATVDENGIVRGVGDGSTTITASTSNGLSNSIDFIIDGTKHLMNLKVISVRQDSNNIGDEWTFRREINGESPSNTIAVSAGETLNFWARYSEEDDNPDVGESSISYYVTENDIANGFTVTMNVYATENGGKNSGQTADFLITYTFTCRHRLKWEGRPLFRGNETAEKGKSNRRQVFQ